MKFKPSPAALALKKARGEPIQAVTNWTAVRRRYRAPTEAERNAVGGKPLSIGNPRVCLDEGVLFVNDGATIYAFTQKELGL